MILRGKYSSSNNSMIYLKKIILNGILFNVFNILNREFNSNVIIDYDVLGLRISLKLFI